MSGSFRAALTVAVLVAALASVGVDPAAGQAPEDRLLPVGEHRTDKARHLAQSYWNDLRQLNNEIYHCMPWLEVQKYGLGFYKPKHVTEDERYLSLRVYIEQDVSPAFAALPVMERAAAMFSRYVHPLLHRMARSPRMLSDPQLDGFNLNLEWLKQTPRAPRDRPVQEGIQVFIHRPDARDFLAGLLPISGLVGRAHVRRWDGETPLGPIALVSAWEDDFVTTYKVKNYQPEPGATCH